MKELFPYHGEKILVTKEMCDHNGHMNTGSYTRCFDGCWGQMYTDMGFDNEYFDKGYSSFTLEENFNVEFGRGCSFVFLKISRCSCFDANSERSWHLCWKNSFANTC